MEHDELEDLMPKGMFHLFGADAFDLWQEYLNEQISPESYGIVVDFTQDPALFDE